MAVGRQDWAEIAAAWELSGERQSAFAARHGVHVETLRSWIYRLRRQRPAKRSKIVEVRVSPATAPTGTSLTEIALPNGISLRVGAGTDVTWASSLAKALLA